jgi:SWI/SNF-related matrix-associated actin-dependent regulator of chromatin subfamily A-like protein 1
MSHPTAGSLYAYQSAGIDWLAARDAAILGDDAGLGKSVQMIEAARRRGADRILVLVDGPGRVSWEAEFAKWWPQLRVYHYPEDTAGLIPDGPLALIVTYGWLSSHPAALQAALAWSQPFKAAFADEVHKLKTQAATRTRAVYGRKGDRAGSVIEGVPVVWVASATLTPKHAGELYTHLRALLPDVLAGLFHGRLPSPVEFETAFCLVSHTGFGKKVEGNNPIAIPALRAALKPHILRRRKADVLPDLPPIQTAPLPLEIADKALREAALDSYMADLPPDTIEADGDILTILGAALADPHIARKRRALGLVKVAPAVAWAADFLEQAPDRKLVIFAHHRDVIAGLAAGLGDHQPLVMVGGTPPATAAAHILTFQTEPTARVFIGQNEAAGTAITLTAASDVLLVEPDWTPVVNYQAISRCHRIGQNQGVLARFAYAHGTMDRRITTVLRRRAQDMLNLWGDAPEGFAKCAA